MRKSENGKKIEKKADLFDRVVIQILVPRCAELNQIRFKDLREKDGGPILRGRCPGAPVAPEHFEINNGVLVLNVVLN